MAEKIIPITDLFESWHDKLPWLLMAYENSRTRESRAAAIAPLVEMAQWADVANDRAREIESL